MAKPKPPALSFWEYSLPCTDRSAVAWGARRELVEACKRVCPQFFRKLRECVYPKYAEIAGKSPKLHRLRWSKEPPRSLNLLAEHEILTRLLQSWAKEFNAEVDWLMDDAFQSLSLWYAEPAMMDSLGWFSGFAQREGCVGDVFQFHFEAWHPQSMKWDEFDKKVRGRFDEALRAYELDVRERAAASGLVLAPRTYSTQNFDWFVLYQFMGMSSVQIVAEQDASDGGSDPSTVLKGVKAAARLIAWPRLRSPSTSRTGKTHA